MTEFRALWIERDDDGFRRSVITRSVDDLPEGELLVEVDFSSLNYKDALSATGNPGVTRAFPHTPGIDAAGHVRASSDPAFAEGDPVVVIGFDLGMNTHGGFAGYVRVPSAWAVPLPEGLTLRDAMILGTAGFTAAACVDKLETAGSLGRGPVLVTGATGGVGSVAVMLLSKLGQEVFAVSGKPEMTDWLNSLGASEVLGRESLLEGGNRPMLAERWGAVVDTVGGEPLVGALKALRYGCSAAICGLVASPTLPATVLPFILRNVNLLGVDSVELPLADKTRIWQRLAGEWRLDGLEELVVPLDLDALPDAIDEILAGRMAGRGLVRPR